MPYNEKKINDILDANPKAAKKAGHRTYLYSMAYLKIWQKYREYEILDVIQQYLIKTVIPPEYPDLQKIKDVDNVLTVIGVRGTALKAAKKMAFREFMAQIGKAYEDKKRKQNGDIYAEEKKWIKETS